MNLATTLENEGFDRSTAETVVQTADSKPIEEAQELLESMLGPQHPRIAEYISKRQHATQMSQLGRRMPSRIIVNETKKPKPANNGPKFTSEDKIDSVKELEAAISQLSVNAAGRERCDCMGSKHGLLEMAPNCLNCGRIVCNKEGLGPCMFCKLPLLPTDRVKQIESILTNQRDEILGTMSKRALNQIGIDPARVKATKSSASSGSSAQAEANLERLLGYQSNDSQRTKIIDRVAEVDLPTPSSGKWMTPDEQAEHIRQQQRRLRQLEKQRKMKQESSRKVISIDMKGKKTYQKVFEAEHIVISDDESEESDVEDGSGDLGDAKTKAATYYDPKQYEAPDISTDVRTDITEPVLAKSAVIRNEDEDLLY